MKNLKTYFSHKKEFHYFSKIRYAQGIGDVCAAVLHSKLVGPITYLVTGKLEPCNTCQNRRTALNFLFPIPIWRLFFKNEDAYNEALNKEFEKFQKPLDTKVHNISDEKKLEILDDSKDSSNNTVEIINDTADIQENSNNSDDIYKDYFLISENRTEHESVLIVNRIYKKL
jgi:hypothetical protein